MTEDQVRDKAGKILGFQDTETAKSGVGQITSFNQLGFKGVKDRPDGWYLPNEKGFPSIVLETKSETTKLNQSHTDELLKNVKIISSKYKDNIGILYNGDLVKIFKNGNFLRDEDELKNKEYYLSIFSNNKIDANRIYKLTARINNNLHFNFGIKNLYHRMVFTACALVAKRYGSVLIEGMNYKTFHTSIHTTLSKSFEAARNQNIKLDILLEAFSSIKMNINENQDAIDDFIKSVFEISDNINSDFWNGEDVMAIFFNEFNRYKGKSESGQVFTPDHVTSLMYKIIEVNKDDRILDAACGSGAFLVKSMCNMINEAGGNSTTKAKEIKKNQLFGIEFDKEIFALSCANMLIHKDGKTNIEQLDSRGEEAKKWIKEKNITKVLMNPPFEDKYGCLDILLNVLDSVPRDTACAFILPDQKLEVAQSKTKKILKHHTLSKIIKLPHETFSGTTTSIFIFKSGIPHNEKKIFACAILSDGLETIKNQGRQDIKNLWPNIEKYWVDIIYRQTGDDSIQWLDPKENLRYPLKKSSFKLSKHDFSKTVLNYILFKNGTDINEVENRIVDYILYDKPNKPTSKLAEIIKNKKNTTEKDGNIDISEWKRFRICGDDDSLFKLVQPSPRTLTEYIYEGDTPFVASGAFNNGVEKYVEVKDGEILDEGNCISVSAIGGFSFYQKNDFIGRGGAGSAIKLLYSEKLNENNALFICTVLKQQLSQYDYNDMISGAKLKKEHIFLPVDKKGNPNWSLMEKDIIEIIKQLDDIKNI